MLDLIPPPNAHAEAPAHEDSKSEETVQAVSSPVRLLTEEEVQSLAPVFAENGSPLPDPSTSFLIGTVDAGTREVTSFLVVQLRVHAEPMWIKPGHEAAFRGLVHTAERIIQERTGGGCDVFLFAPAGKIARMAEVAGMRTEPWVVYSKTIPLLEQPAPQTARAKRVPVWQRDSAAKEPIQ